MNKVYILDLGALELDANVMLRFATRAKRTDPAAPAKWIRIPVWAALIVTDEHRILFDLGCMPDAMEGGWPPTLQDNMPVIRNEEQYIGRQLARAGYKPEDIDTVILSHLHADHFGAIEQFTHCDIYLPREEWANALISTHMTADRYSGGTYSRRCIDTPVKRYHPIDKGDEFEIFPGIEILSLPGHTVDLIGLLVKLENTGYMILPSDAVAMQETWDDNVIGGIPYDSAAFQRSVEKVRRLQKKLNAVVMLSHSSKMFDIMKKAPEFYD